MLAGNPASKILDLVTTFLDGNVTNVQDALLVRTAILQVCEDRMQGLCNNCCLHTLHGNDV